MSLGGDGSDADDNCGHDGMHADLSQKVLSQIVLDADASGGGTPNARTKPGWREHAASKLYEIYTVVKLTNLIVDATKLRANAMTDIRCG
jgi:hypothetical protein